MGPTHAEEIIPTSLHSPLQIPQFFLTHQGDKHSPILRFTNLLPSDLNKLNLDSSLK